MPFFLCAAAFMLSYAAGRRSLVGGLVATTGIGYAYGIVRANVPGAGSHFIFDAAVLGLYAAQLWAPLDRHGRDVTAPLRRWVEVLMAWCLLIFFLPVQDFLVQLVGLRGAIFFLPFLLLGARLDAGGRYSFALWLAAFNVCALFFAGAEFVFGIERFYPHNEVTEIIYMSKDVAGASAYRIPSLFVNAHAYGGVMAVTLPFTLGALVQGGKSPRHKYLFVASVVASTLGVLLCAARTPAIVLGVLFLVTLFSVKGRLEYLLVFALVIVGVAWLALGETRLQRFMELQDTEMVSERFSGSVNMRFMEVAEEYPFGNGLGGGGTSLPYFIAERLQNPVVIENEYARIMLEQGVVGLLIWVAFILWVVSRRGRARDPWRLGRRLAWAMSAMLFSLSLTGTGLLTSIPQTALFLMSVGWLGSQQDVFRRPRGEKPASASEGPGVARAEARAA